MLTCVSLTATLPGKTATAKRAGFLGRRPPSVAVPLASKIIIITTVIITVIIIIIIIIIIITIITPGQSHGRCDAWG